jgi:hypothetical protein
MSPTDGARLVIELDLEAQPIGGWLTSPAAGARPFVGWLDLMAALEQARVAELQALLPRERSRGWGDGAGEAPVAGYAALDGKDRAGQ